MAGDYEKAISIRDAIDNINAHDYLLPAIQRKFVWSSHQICVLFDSIMRNYPINSFMMWEVKSDDIKNDYKFYEFVKEYCQRFNEENPHFITNASSKDFKAVIDGQQRLTSLYIGLCSTYAYKQPRVWWPSAQDDAALPPRKLYLDLMQPLKSEDDDSLMLYNFKFLTDKQHSDSLKSKDRNSFWFCMHEILRFPQVDGSKNIWQKIVQPYLNENGLENNGFADDTLFQLYETIRCEKTIHYFNETSQKIDHVLDVFIRTNSGGTKLDFSDLLMSIAVANWDGDFRQELDWLVKEIHQSSDMGFYLGRDWILKTCLMLVDADVKFKVKNFKAEQVSLIQQQWVTIKACIKATFKLLRRFGINPQSLTSKNAVIPVVYYLYKKQFENKPLYESINNLTKVPEQREVISQWFYMALLKGIFGGQADAILISMRDVLSKNIDEPTFPLDKIVERYKGSNKDLRFDREYIDNLLDIQHGEGRCRALLHLLFPEMKVNEIYHIDHLHPQSAFKKTALKDHEFINNDEELKGFYQDPLHWNSIANLHLLNDSQNISKSDKPLKQWVAEDGNDFKAGNFLVGDAVSLDFSDFPIFFENRRDALRSRLMTRVYMADIALAEELLLETADEEVVEEELIA